MASKCSKETKDGKDDKVASELAFGNLPEPKVEVDLTAGKLATIYRSLDIGPPASPGDFASVDQAAGDV